MGLVRQIFDFFGRIFQEDDPIVQAIVVDTAGVLEATIDESADYNAGATSNELLFVKKYSDQLTNFWDIDNAEGEFLNTLGSKWLDVQRRAGENDSTYLKRIRAVVTGYRNTPYGLERIARIFSPSYVLIQEGLSGFGAVGRSFLGYFVNEDQGYDILTTEELSSVVSAISGGLTTFTVADATGFLVDDEVWHDDGVNPTRMYRIVSIASNDITINERGYIFYDNLTSLAFAATNPCQIIWNTHGLVTDDYIEVKESTDEIALPNGQYQVTVIDPNTFSVPVDASSGSGTCSIINVYKDSVVLISGNATGTLKRYEKAKVMRCYMGSITSGLLRIRVTVETTPLTTDPVVARFLVDILNKSKIPGTRIEVVYQ